MVKQYYERKEKHRKKEKEKETIQSMTSTWMTSAARHELRCVRDGHDTYV